MSVQSKTLAMVHDNDPRKEIFDIVGADIADIEINGVDVLTIVYERPEKTKSGILLPETSSARSEDRFQGIVALVVKIGPNAHEKADQFKDGVIPQIGDWVIFRTRDSDPFLIGKRTARLIEVQMIKAVVKRPDMVA